MKKKISKFFSKKTVRIIVSVLVVVLLAGVITGIVTVATRKTKSISTLTSFSVGDIDAATGKYVKDKTSIYTKDFIGCQGLSVVRKFETTSEYKIYWYNEKKTYFGSTEMLDDSFDASDVPLSAHYCKIVIYPDMLDENGKVITDFKINLWNIYTHAKDYTITVNKEQILNYEDLYKKAQLRTCKYDTSDKLTSIADSNEFFEHWWYNNNGDGTLNFVDGVRIAAKDEVAYDGCMVKLNCEDVAQYKIIFNERQEEKHYMYALTFKSDGTPLTSEILEGKALDEFIVNVHDDAAYAVFLVAEVAKPIEIYEYLGR